MKLKKIFIVSLNLSILSFNLFSLEEDDNKNLDFKKKEFKANEILYKKVAYFILDLKEPQNISIFIPSKEVSSCIINGVMEGKITPYEDENLKIKITKEDFMKNMKDPKIVIYDESLEFQNASKNNSNSDVLPTKDEMYLSKDLSRLKIMADIYFDNITSEQHIKIYSIGIVVPGSEEGDVPTISKDIAYFKYEELMNYFRKKNPEESYIDTENLNNSKTFDKYFDSLEWLPFAYQVGTQKSKILNIDYNGGIPDLNKKELKDLESEVYSY